MKIKVAIVGVGNCASSFVQGLEYYQYVDETSPPVPGLMHNNFGGYLIRDIEVVAAFDVNGDKIGKDVSEAIWTPPTNSRKFADVPNKGVAVNAGFLGDGIAPHMRDYFPLREAPERVIEVIRNSGVEILISFLPVGSQKATRFYAQTCLDVGIAFINGISEFIASDPEWAEKFRQAGIPCAGDDIQCKVPHY